MLGKLPVPGRPTSWITVGQGLTALAVGAGGVVRIFLLSSIFLSSFSLSLGDARYRIEIIFVSKIVLYTVKIAWFVIVM